MHKTAITIPWNFLLIYHEYNLCRILHPVDVTVRWWFTCFVFQASDTEYLKTYKHTVLKEFESHKQYINRCDATE